MLGFPNELVEMVLCLLDAKYVVQFKRVSRRFRDIVNRSVQLQYIIECYLAAVVDNPARDDVRLSERLRRLREWRAASAAGRFVMTSTEHDTTGGEFSVAAFGSVYVERHGNRFTIVQPACPLRGRSEKKWTVEAIGFTPLAFAYDHSEKLLALTERRDYGDCSDFRVHLLSSLTGEPHPMAITPILTIFDSIVAHHDHTDDPVCSLVIFASMLATTVCSLDLYDASADVCVFQWKSGELLLDTYGDCRYGQAGFDFIGIDARSLSFLDEEHILIPYTGGAAGVAVLETRRQDNSRRHFTLLLRDAVLRLDLPPLVQHTDDDYPNQYYHVHTLIQPQHPQRALPEDIFLHDPSSTLLSIAFGGYADEEFGFAWSYSIVIPAGIVHTLMAEHRKLESRTVGSAKWVPYARMVHTHGSDDGGDSLPICVPTCGTRCLVRDAPPPDGYEEDTVFKLYFHDLLRPEFLRNATMSRGAVTDGTVFDDPDVWAEPFQVGTRTPFVKVATEMAVGYSDICALGEDFMVIWKQTGPATARKDVYVLQETTSADPGHTMGAPRSAHIDIN